METTLTETLPQMIHEVRAAGVIIKAVIIMAVISAIAGFGTYIERKVLAFHAKTTWADACGTLWVTTNSSRWD